MHLSTTVTLSPPNDIVSPDSSGKSKDGPEKAFRTLKVHSGGVPMSI